MKLIRSSIMVLAIAAGPAAFAAPIYEQLFIADVVSGASCEVDVDAAGNLSSVSTLGGCSGLTGTSGTVPVHQDLLVFGLIGQFNVHITGGGGTVVNLPPDLQTLTQVNVQNTGTTGGVLLTQFTDTHYCQDPGQGCFGTDFHIQVQQNPSNPGTTTLYHTTVDASNGVPASTMLGPDLSITGFGVNSSNPANPIGVPFGSLSSETITSFAGSGGSAQTNYLVSTTGTFVPEPSTIGLFGFGAGLIALAHRRRKA
jgi:hypothetical protein